MEESNQPWAYFVWGGGTLINHQFQNESGLKLPMLYLSVGGLSLYYSTDNKAEAPATSTYTKS